MIKSNYFRSRRHALRHHGGSQRGDERHAPLVRLGEALREELLRFIKTAVRGISSRFDAGRLILIH